MHEASSCVFVYVCVQAVHECLFFMCMLVHKGMFYIRNNLRMLQYSNIECKIRMFILSNKMMYLVILWSLNITLAMK